MKYNRIRILVAATILALLVTAVPATPVQAAELLTVNPNQGEIGADIDIFGFDFDAYERVYIYFSSDEAEVRDDIDELDAFEYLGRDRTGSTGTADEGEFDKSSEVPSELSQGDHPEDVHGGEYYIYASYDREGRIEAVCEFTVTGIELQPKEGNVGDEIEINGAGFDNDRDIDYIKYDGVETEIASGDEETDSDGEFTCTIIIPESTAGDHTIRVEVRYDEVRADFTVEPEITTSPTSGLTGDTITVSGTGFSYRKDVTIYFNDVTMTLTSGTAGTDKYGSFENLKFNVPAVASDTYDVKVKDKANKIATAEFTIAVAASFSPTTGYVGTEIPVSGTASIPNRSITITFADVRAGTAVTDDRGSFTTSFNVPAYAAGTYKVKVNDGVNTEEANFTVLTSASISPVTSVASPGHVGTELTISGLGFTVGRTVTIKYDEAQVATATVKPDATFLATFKVSASRHGEHNITATDGTITKQFTFTMESTAPPIPAPLLPEMDVKAKAEAYFDWEDVTDPSLPVTYTLQIASDGDFTSIERERKDLTDSEYTVTEEEKLEPVSKKAPYYWRVKAIDGASNESGWSDTGSFYVGFSLVMPQWAIYTLFGIGALLLGFLGFWVGRKTAYYYSY